MIEITTLENLQGLLQLFFPNAMIDEEDGELCIMTGLQVDEFGVLHEIEPSFTDELPDDLSDELPDEKNENCTLEALPRDSALEEC